MTAHTHTTHICINLVGRNAISLRTHAHRRCRQRGHARLTSAVANAHTHTHTKCVMCCLSRVLLKQQQQQQYVECRKRAAEELKS